MNLETPGFVPNEFKEVGENFKDELKKKKMKVMTIVNKTFTDVGDQVPHWPPLFEGECEEVREAQFQSFGQSRGEPLPVGFSPRPTSAPTVCTDVFSDVAPIGVLAERLRATGARRTTTASALTPRCDYKNGEFTRVLGSVLLAY